MFHWFLNDFGVLAFFGFPTLQNGPRGPEDRPKTAQEDPKTAQEAPKTAQEGPKAAQEAPKTAPRRLLGALRPSTVGSGKGWGSHFGRPGSPGEGGMGEGETVGKEEEGYTVDLTRRGSKARRNARSDPPPLALPGQQAC